MHSYVVNGGKKLKGSITVNPSKNASIAILIAALLNDKETVIKNLPKIEEVFRVIEVIESLGAQTEWKDDHVFKITPPKEITLKNLNVEAALKTRIMILLIGVLAHKFKNFSLPFSGGCKLGRRTIMPHIYALENFGINIKVVKNKYEVSHDGLKPCDNVIMYESGDTATENAILAASMIEGKTVLKFASANYQVQDVCFFLKKLGVRFEGMGGTTLTIHGKKSLSKKIDFSVTEDPIEAMFFISTAIVTKSSIVIKRCPIEFLELELFKLKKMGFKFNVGKEYKSSNGYSRLVDIETFPSNLSAPCEKIYGRPFPGLNIDNLPFFAPIATQAKGETLVHDWVFENRAIYFMELGKMGANITLADPHRVFIKGPVKLKPADIVSIPALRPSAIMLVAMLGAKGKSILRNVYIIERGYEDLCGRLKSIGSDIERVTNDKY
ncbi:MAG: UDP-N-acetylglucosamine 1-carboxyvinyltransferase [Candidatus Terrybacteria bacterium CG10_big_fil_rev_8_21_14_0_10_41_10]|uniref:UDP-N-acetylglucosamine 1-carboxyvinyltransferase n=1 Tax=Candidatus Terrybacteria bacterium CG10_big_fil_rev_8_21_14_0_10_41_10 TaxID=1975026 RepID=A0A2M8LAN1_9BACT|nr:MAG: UDP-N-acetylglucosamine 1-carboxyvinyltransferase [Candidatus Terrybacteria bacterium CG10_big_fil_rev_8_21_14_0_10_41_10]